MDLQVPWMCPFSGILKSWAFLLVFGENQPISVPLKRHTLSFRTWKGPQSTDLSGRLTPGAHSEMSLGKARGCQTYLSNQQEAMINTCSMPPHGTPEDIGVKSRHFQCRHRSSGQRLPFPEPMGAAVHQNRGTHKTRGGVPFPSDKTDPKKGRPQNSQTLRMLKMVHPFWWLGRKTTTWDSHPPSLARRDAGFGFHDGLGRGRRLKRAVQFTIFVWRPEGLL